MHEITLELLIQKTTRVDMYPHQNTTKFRLTLTRGFPNFPSLSLDSLQCGKPWRLFARELDFSRRYCDDLHTQVLELMNLIDIT